MRNFIGNNGLIWFVGVVEDRHDPIELGRVRVRAFGWHTDDKAKIPTEELPWAIPMSGIDSASVSGVGKSPTGMVEGTWVFGFFMDGKRAQEPAVIGTIATMPSEKADVVKGFNDPNGLYPRYTDESDVNKLARGLKEPKHISDEIKNDFSEIKEPAEPFAAKYPYNHVTETESGHIKEYDDTAGKERIREWHKTGTFYEIHPDGTKVEHIVKDNYQIIAGNNAIHVKGNVDVFIDANTNITVSGNLTALVKKNADITINENLTALVNKDAEITVDGNTTLKVGKNFDASIGGTCTMKSGGNMKFTAPKIDIN